MSWIAVAIGGSAVLGYLGSQNAASTQAAGQQQAAATQQGMFNTINQQEQPFMQAGYGATSALNQLMGLSGGGQTYNFLGPNPTGTVTPIATAQANVLSGGSSVGGLPNGYLTQQFTPQNFVNTPQYQFQLQQGGQAIRNADTPGLGALSGAALKDLMGFNQGLASSTYGNYFNMQQTAQNNIFARLSGLAGLGQNAATNVGTSGTSLGTGIAQAQAGAAGSQAAGIVGGTNAITSGLNNGAAYLQLGSLMSGGQTYNPTAGVGATSMNGSSPLTGNWATLPSSGS